MPVELRKDETSREEGGIVVGRRDYERLLALVEKHDNEAAEALEEELARARIVEEPPANVVSMNARVGFSDLDSGQEMTIRLVYPHEADVATMKISVLSPVGCALLGLGVDDVIDWPLPGGKRRRMKVTSVELEEN